MQQTWNYFLLSKKKQQQEKKILRMNMSNTHSYIFYEVNEIEGGNV